MAEKIKGKIVVGMSGGVDSSMTLVLLKEQGWDPIGVSLKYAVWQDKDNALRENVCCSTDSFKIAKDVCKKVGVPHHIVDVSKKFQKNVIEYFLQELRDKKTPNPCIVCNRRLKFKELFAWAKKNGIKYVATGHYARIKENKKTGKHELRRAKDKNKDQTYSLSFLSQAQLKKIVLPLGKYTKKEIYTLAKKKGFDVFEKEKQSQDFCFVAGNSLSCFLEKEIGSKKGEIKNLNGEFLGEHRGLHFYTTGQRKGLGIPNGPYFVIGRDVEKNELIVSRSQKDLLAKSAVLSPCNFNLGKPRKGMNVRVKIRSHHKLAKAKLSISKNGKVKIVFEKNQKSITPGQFAVFYDREICLGGGRIVKVKEWN